MSEDRLESILSKQRAAAERREAAAAEQLRKKAEKEQREQELLATWNGIQNGLKKIVFDLNKRMEANDVSLEYQDISPVDDTPYSANIRYSSPFDYQIKSHSLDITVNRVGQLTASIRLAHRQFRSEDMHVDDFDETSQEKWVLDFLEFTAEPDAAE